MRIAIPVPESILSVMKAISAAGGISLVVGGAVRDAIMQEIWNTPVTGKDLDIEVFKLQFKDLFEILSQFGKVDLVGADFGVLKFRNDEGEFDFSIPRNDKRLGAGHKNFEVSLNPFSTFKEAAARRDFTMNAAMWDFTTSEVIDPFNGVSDIQNLILRPVGESFAEDALRVLRGMQFAARFGMSAAPNIAAITRPMIGEFFDLPRERVREEWVKWAERGAIPSMGLIFLLAAGWIDPEATEEDFAATDIHVERIREMRKAWIEERKHVLEISPDLLTIEDLEIQARELFPFSSEIVAASGLFPELQRLIGTPQDAHHHPEGNVWNHSLIGIDEMVKICNRDGVSGENPNSNEWREKRIIRVFGILCHDMGKPSTTVFEDDGRITSAHHAEEGEWHTRTFMWRIGFGNVGQKSVDPIVEAVVPLVTKHMVHFSGGHLSDGTIRRLSLATDLHDLAAVVEADHSSRPPKEKGMPAEMARVVERAAVLKVLDEKPKPILKGQHLIDAFGWRQGKHFKPILEAAKEAQMDGVFNDEVGAIIWAGVEIAAGRFSQS